MMPTPAEIESKLDAYFAQTTTKQLFQKLEGIANRYGVSFLGPNMDTEDDFEVSDEIEGELLISNQAGWIVIAPEVALSESLSGNSNTLALAA
jgi:hypothetical protein